MEDFENSAILTHVPWDLKQQIVFKLKSIVNCVMRELGIGTRVNTRTGPYDCAMLLVQVKGNKITWNLEVATLQSPYGLLPGCNLYGAPNAAGLHNQTEGADDQQH